MSLHVILGFETARNTEEPTVLYAGRSGDAARRAVEASVHEYHLIFQNPVGVRKHNARAGANRAALDPQTVARRAREAQLRLAEQQDVADELAARGRAQAEAAIVAKGVAEKVVGVVKDAIAQVALDAADAADADAAEAERGPVMHAEPTDEDAASHFGKRARRK